MRLIKTEQFIHSFVNFQIKKTTLHSTVAKKPSEGKTSSCYLENDTKIIWCREKSLRCGSKDKITAAIKNMRHEGHDVHGLLLLIYMKEAVI